MAILTLTNAVALLSFILLFLAYKKMDDKAVYIVIGFLILICTVIKGCKDDRASTLSQLKDDTVIAYQDTINKKTLKIDTLSWKIDTLNSYVKGLDSVGLKRNSDNTFTITKTFYTYIHQLDKLEQR